MDVRCSDGCLAARSVGNSCNIVSLFLLAAKKLDDWRKDSFINLIGRFICSPAC